MPQVKYDPEADKLIPLQSLRAFFCELRLDHRPESSIFTSKVDQNYPSRAYITTATLNLT